MRTFLLIATALLGLLHYYIGSRLLPALGLSDTAAALAWAVLALSVLLIPASLIARHITRPPLADRLTWAGSIAMGLFSSVLVLTALRDLAQMLAADHLPAAFGTLSAQGVILLATLVTLAGFINARRTASVVTVDVPLANLPEALQGFTIAQISDIHVGPTIKRGYLDRIVDRVNTLQPDLIAVTGDLVDGSVRDLAPHTEPLKRLAARYGAYFVTGNHEYLRRLFTCSKEIVSM